MIKLHAVIFLAVCLICVSYEASAQRVSVSTDLVEWCTLSPNVGVEFTASQHSTVALSASFSPWRLSEGMWLRHVTITPEYRYWLSVPMSGHSIGGRLVYSSFDFGGAAGGRAAGTLFGAGAVYGWAKVQSSRLNLRPFVCCGAAFCIETGGLRIRPMVDIGMDIQIVLR